MPTIYPNGVSNMGSGSQASGTQVQQAAMQNPYSGLSTIGAINTNNTTTTSSTGAYTIGTTATTLYPQQNVVWNGGVASQSVDRMALVESQLAEILAVIRVYAPLFEGMAKAFSALHTEDNGEQEKKTP